MALLDVEDLMFKYTDKELYTKTSFRILPKEHIVIVGPNGSGKSTFMNIIAKNIIPDSGKVEWLPNIKFAYLDQHLKVKEDISIHDYLIQVFKELFLKEKEMNSYFDELKTADESKHEKLLTKAMMISEYLNENKFYQISSTLGNITNGLGITAYGLETKLKTLSGGMRAKVYLAKLLLDEPDVLLMDEPTNFLDIEHIEWLEKYLNSFEKAFVVISHDEKFISNIAKVVYALENKEFIRYKGDYEFYLKEKGIRADHYEKAYANQQKYIKKTQEFIDKNIVRATTSKQAKSKRKALEKIEVLDKPLKEMKIKINFPFSKNLGQEVLKLTKLSVGYNNKPILSPIDYLIKHNEKIAILGHNGVGKSTIVKTILGFIEPISGSYKFNPSADINYFSQEEKFDNITPIQYLRGFYPSKDDLELRGVLSALGINRDLVLKSMNELSGGEQTKVRIALMTMKKSNLLIFDEPTNHLDNNSKKVLFEAIKNFPGSVILISHEKDFYDGLVDFEMNFN